MVHARVRTNEDGQRLLVATKLDASRRTMQLRLGEVFFLDFLALTVGPGVFAAATIWTGPYAVLLTLALTVGLFRAVRALLGPADVIVGADGVIVRQSFRSRFLPFGTIASIDRVRDRPVLTGREALTSLTGPLVLRLTDGTQVQARTRHLTPAERAQLTARIDDARKAWDAGVAGPSALVQLDRNGRSTAAWRAAMQELLAAPEGYRNQGVTRDALVEVLESPSAPVERRVAAAMALARVTDDDGRARIRVAAGACADERVRIALARAADGELDDDAAEEALAVSKARA